MLGYFMLNPSLTRLWNVMFPNKLEFPNYLMRQNISDNLS